MSRKSFAALIIVLALVLAPAWLRRDIFITNKGVFHFRKGEYSRSVEWLERSLALRPESWNAVSHLAAARFRLGEYRQAGDILQEYLERHPDHEEARFARALIHFHGGAPDLSCDLLKAVPTADVRRALGPGPSALILAFEALDSDNPYGVLNSLEETGMTDREQEAVRRGLMGISWFRLGRGQKARDHILESLNLFPDNPLLLAILAAIELNSGNIPDASYYLDRALSLGFEPASGNRILPASLPEGGIPAPILPSGGLPLKHETIPLSSTGAIPDGMALIPGDPRPVLGIFQNSALQIDLTRQAAGTYMCIMEARGTSVADIWPRARVSVNGIPLGHVYFKGGSWEHYPLTLHLPPGQNILEIAYINDTERLLPAQDRNLFLRGIYITMEE